MKKESLERAANQVIFNVEVYPFPLHQRLSCVRGAIGAPAAETFAAEKTCLRILCPFCWARPKFPSIEKPYRI